MSRRRHYRSGRRRAARGVVLPLAVALLVFALVSGNGTAIAFGVVAMIAALMVG